MKIIITAKDAKRGFTIATLAFFTVIYFKNSLNQYPESLMILFCVGKST